MKNRVKIGLKIGLDLVKKNRIKVNLKFEGKLFIILKPTPLVIEVIEHIFNWL